MNKSVKSSMVAAAFARERLTGMQTGDAKLCPFHHPSFNTG